MALAVHARPPAVAGQFYPADPGALASMVDELLAESAGGLAGPPSAVILPHAGYRFSGAAVATAAALLRPGPARVIVVGPSHHHAFRGVALPVEDAMATPLGPIPLDPVCRTLTGQPDIAVVPEAHAREHGIEVELPFLQRRLGNITLIPLVVGDIAPARLAEILTPLWQPDTLLVVSTDLTHFLTARRAEESDLATARQVELGLPDRIGAHEACGHRPLAAFLLLAARRGLRLIRRALTHSGAVTGDRNRVVGYGAWTAHAPGTAAFAPKLRQDALRLAAQALTRRARQGRAPALHLPSFGTPLQSIGATFVTLTRDGRLRGCIGALKPHRPLAEDILTNAIKAGFEDPRYQPFDAESLAGTEIEIALLSPPTPLTIRDEADLLAQLTPGEDGLLLTDGRYRGTFLPKVWQSLDTPERFVAGLKIKAGLPKDHWSDTLEIRRYRTETFAGTIAA